jgi:phosphopantothenoylcysteine decarboxylase/phosphopantothenate--cysteine ligase
MAHIVLGVSAGIAGYKAVDMASKLTQRGDEVRAILTPHAVKFVTALSFRAVTRQPVYTDTFEDDPEYRTEHISLAEWADVILVAPATADLIARVAAGICDNLLSLTIVSSQKPVIFAPAMNDRMWANPIVKENIARLKSIGYLFLEPGVGHLACGSIGPGRLPEPGEMIAAIDSVVKARIQ